MSGIIEVDNVLAFAHGHAWVPLASLSTNLLIRLTKTQLRSSRRPLAALVCGFTAGGVAGLYGVSWHAALLGGFIAGMMAITSYDLVAAFRKGRDNVPKLP